MPAEEFDKYLREIDALIEHRIAVYPVRDEGYVALNNKIRELCGWLGSQQAVGWQPDQDEVAHAEALKPLFVGGFYKSGTTFILNLLDAHPRLSALPGDARLLEWSERMLPLPEAQRAQETRQRWIQVLVTPMGLPPNWLFGREPGPYIEFLNYLDYWMGKGTPADHRTVMQAIARAYYAANPQRSDQARYWVDKTPFQELRVAELQRLYPEMHFLHVVRNPLAILAAMKTIATDRSERFRMVHQAGLLRQSLHEGLQHHAALGEDQYRLLRYEDTLSDPAGTMAAIAAWLGIPDDDSLIQPTINGLPSTPNSAYKENRLQGQIQTKSAEKWRQHLTPGEVWMIVDLIGPEAAACGYDWGDLRPTPLQRFQARVGRLFTNRIGDPVARLGARIVQAARRRLVRGRASAAS